jgi:glycosyltransferase involved in cell wall biosynthesis
MSSNLKVLGLVPYPLDQVPSQRYRIEQLLPALRAEGITVDVAPFMTAAEYAALYDGGLPAKASAALGGVQRRIRLLRAAGRYDVALLHREAALFGPAVFEPLFAARLPMVYDFDDAIWLRSPNPASRHAALLKFPGKTRTIVARSAAVLAGNGYLTAWAKQHNPNTHLVPTTVDIDGAYAVARRHEAVAVPVVGWTGSPSTFRYFAELRPLLAELAARRSFRIRVIGAPAGQHWPELDVEWLPWTSASEVTDCIAMDIGVMPQPNDEWAKGKCGFKALQYMALGIPTVAGHSGVLPEIIADGSNGYLARSRDEWSQRLLALLDDWTLRARMGEAGRITVRERYSTRVHAPRVADILKAVAA